MAYLAVNKDGQETISQDLPERCNENTHYANLGNAVQWCDFGDFETYENSTIYLPKGSIKKLIGRDLAWQDEPVEFI